MESSVHAGSKVSPPTTEIMLLKSGDQATCALDFILVFDHLQHSPLIEDFEILVSPLDN